ncbi:ABC transporter substrate-binding protein [Desmospora activa]|uniref:Probable sugar-binding periplasmic protein n=1 Tax=Desmospora activa DSM 45169 TaxID=1121389 RepID=A0A2T4ZB92_9BACL|nr:ABC transporter substrate-binding protein [Desmospora activa]PTM59150.1 carbohydrate ABC transporter substrate-binding protein (CUT1 family) [Desmospora activa DSM 45169]
MGRKRVFAFLTAVLLVLTACGGGTEGQSGNEVEIFSWWTGAGEEAGLNALIQLFEEENSDIRVNNAAVAGGAGTNAKATLATRMQGNDPPDTFQVHGGSELNDSWVAADKMEPLTELYQQEEWNDKFPQELIDLVSHEGEIYSVPVNIHRGNVLWYSPSIFKENGLEPPRTFAEFFEVADQLKKKGIVPLALGDKESWAATHLLETVLLGKLGPDDYNKLWTGEIPFDDPKVIDALETFKKMLQYTNKDHAARNWQDAAQMVASGDAAMNVMGDWAKGYFTADLKLEPKKDFDWIETPESEGSFMVITDTFGLPKGSKNPEGTKKFLQVLGSVEGQDTFNPLKGSIPARLDADREKYDVYGQETMDDFKESALTPSLAHGSAAPEGFVTETNQAVNSFVTQGKVDATVQLLQQKLEAALK